MEKVSNQELITIKDAMDELYSGIKFDKVFLRTLAMYTVDYITRNEDHRLFFGGKLIGCYTLRFTITHYENFFSEVIGVDPDKAEELCSTITTINQSYKISSDAMNLTLLYFIHRFSLSKQLTPKEKTEAVKTCFNIYNYRTMAALVTNYFKYPITENMAQTVYENLSGRYLIKRLNNWREYFEYRADETIKLPYYKDLVEFKSDTAIVNIANDLFTRIKDMMKNIYKVFMEVRLDDEESIKSTDRSITNLEGEESIADDLTSSIKYKNYILETMKDEKSFYKEDLVTIVYKSIPGTTHQELKKVILKIPQVYLSQEHHKNVNEIVEKIIELSIQYLKKIRYDFKHKNNITMLLQHIKNYILSSRGNDELDEIKYKVDGLIDGTSDKKLGGRTTSILRNGFILYIFLRAFTMHYYK